MIAHVAEASEASGRVVVWIDPLSPVSPLALETAARVASAFGSEIETVVIDAADLTRIREVPHRRVGRGLVVDAPADAAGLLGERQRRLAERWANAASVPIRHSVRNGHAIDRLAEMCASNGPWNIITLSSVPTSGLGPVISDILANISGATGVIVTGRKSRKQSGRVAIVAEDAERLPSMLRAAERLRSSHSPIHVLIAAETKPAYAELDAQARLLVGNRPDVIFETTGPSRGVDGALDECLVRTAAGFVIARFGGLLLSGDTALSRLLNIGTAPFLLVR